MRLPNIPRLEGLTRNLPFSWWVPYTLRKRNVIVPAVTARARKTTHKYGILVPRNVEHAHRLDKENGNDYWAKSLQKEM